MYRRKETKKVQEVGQQIYKEAFEPLTVGRNTHAARAASIFTVVENSLDLTRVRL